MSAMLSPAKPVRTRFRVPGEGAYELAADLLPSASAICGPGSGNPALGSAQSPSSASRMSSVSSGVSSGAPSGGLMGLPGSIVGGAGNGTSSSSSASGGGYVFGLGGGGSTGTSGSTGPFSGGSGGGHSVSNNASTNGAAQTGGAAQAKAATSGTAGPLGLACCTKVAVATSASLVDSTRDLSASSNASILPGLGAANNTISANGPAVEAAAAGTSGASGHGKEKDSGQATGGTSLFSLRKLSGLSSLAGLSGRMTGNGTSSPSDTAQQPGNTVNETAVARNGAPGLASGANGAAARQSPSLSNGMPFAALSTGTSPARPRYGNAANKTEPRPDMGMSTHPNTHSGSYVQAEGTAEQLNQTRTASTNAPGGFDETGTVSMSEAPTPFGVLAYSFGDSVVVLDLATHSSFSTSPGADASLTLRLRAQPTSHTLEQSGDKLRLLVGCINGEVSYWEDLASVYTRDVAGSGKRSRTSASAAAMASAVGVTSSAAQALGSGSNSSSQVIFNRDGAINSSRVVAVQWLPGPAFRFAAVHMDGAVVIYDTRHKKATVPQAAPAMTEASNGAGPLNAVSGTENSTADPSRPMPGSSFHGISSHAPKTQWGRKTHDARAEHDDGAVSAGRRSLTSSDPDGSASSAANANSAGLGVDRGPGSSNTPDAGHGGDQPLNDTDRGAHVSTGHRRSGSTASIPPAVVGQHDVFISRPARGKRANPIAVWQVGCGAVSDAAFSPSGGANGDQALLAVSSRDGFLRIIDIARESVVATFRSYFGALLCVSWSPDGCYVATGGEDDLVSIWSPSDERIVARCEGHTSWVSSVAWDSTLSSGGRYRLASAGQDTKLLFWDFSLDMLVTRSSAHRSSRSYGRNRSYTRSYSLSSSGSVSATSGNGNHPQIGQAGPPGAQDAPLTSDMSARSTQAQVGSGGAFNGSPSQGANVGGGSAPSEKRQGKLARLRGHSGASNGQRSDELEPTHVAVPPGPIYPALGRADVPVVEPVVAHVAHVEPLTDVQFLDTGVVTADCVGNVKLWLRPPQQHVPPLALAKTGHIRVANTGSRRVGRQRTGDLD